MALPARKPSPWKRNAFAIIELPLVICLFVALLGIVSGTILWYRSGTLTASVGICFGLAVPLLAIVTVISLSAWRNQRGGE
jgi:hypothetical protein